ncbi:DNA-processing protein DprA [Candidatus Pelagibacter sp. HIMB1495]|uniref:DNA-processing protein DprA n=1 Tax=unclassified Candidatus Pelagibacter TaxID=2647897 RepID=UPI003F835055
MTTLNINTLILTLSKIKNFGRKKIFKSISLIENLNTLPLNEAYKALEIDTKISEKEFLSNYKISKEDLKKINNGKVEVINIFENDKFNFFKNKMFLNNNFEQSEFPNQLFLINKTNLNLNNKKIFTVIGTRNNSKESKEITEKIVNYLVKKQIIIASGLAKGIDTIAHQKVANLNGIGIAILGNGLDSIYPAENRDLAKKILTNGILLSEYPFGVKAEGFRLVERDRIQAMMASDVVLIESKIDGGSMHAIKWARKLNKRVWCFDINASGNIDTIKNGAIKFSNLEEFISSYNNEIKQ